CRSGCACDPSSPRQPCFFFQAEDGIRDFHVTGVQTCALPICPPVQSERRAATLASHGVDAINMHHSDWTGGLTTLFHRFDVLAFGGDAQTPRVPAGLVDLAIDGGYRDHVDRLVDAVPTAHPDVG